VETWTQKPPGLSTDIKKGDLIIVHHFTFFDNDGVLLDPWLTIDGVGVYDVNANNAFCIVRDGDVLEPLGEYILGEIVYEEVLKSDFIQLLDSTARREVENKAKVIAVSEDTKDFVEVGAEVFLLRYANYKIDFRGKTFLRFRKSEIIGDIIHD
jgi:co-chaperonin GroES (HSP10)